MNCDCVCETCQALKDELERTKERLKYVRSLLHNERVRHAHLVAVMEEMENHVTECKDKILKWPVEAEEVEDD